MENKCCIKGVSAGMRSKHHALSVSYVARKRNESGIYMTKKRGRDIQRGESGVFSDVVFSWQDIGYVVVCDGLRRQRWAISGRSEYLRHRTERKGSWQCKMTMNR